MDLTELKSLKEILIGDGWVMHARPPEGEKRGNSFRYSIFNLLLPISEIEVGDLSAIGGKKFFTLSSRDYLDGQGGDFSQCIRDFLQDNLSYAADEVWLQTLPRMFGYSFNPISFWWCYKGQALDAVLCEVNNTFGDRHFYFVQSPLQEGAIVKRLDKVFHVSPFLPIAGAYSFSFKEEGRRSIAKIQLHINDRLALDTAINLKLGRLQQRSSYKILKKYGWLTVMIILRIHTQAFRIWLKKIPFFHRPQPPKERISS